MSAHTDRQTRFSNLSEAYSKVGLPLTSQRRALLEVLADRCDHPTVDQIHVDVLARLPEVSRTTVYRSLEILCERGIIQRVEHPGSAVRFDPNTAPHHHFLCTRCGGLQDLSLESIAGSEQLELLSPEAGQVGEMTVVVRGLCPTCQQA